MTRLRKSTTELYFFELICGAVPLRRVGKMSNYSFFLIFYEKNVKTYCNSEYYLL